MSLVTLIITYVLATLAQLTFVNAFAVMGATPDLLLCITLAIVFLYEGGYRCIPFGIAGSLLTGVAIEGFMGVDSLLLFGLSVGLYYYRARVNTENIIPFLLYSTAATVVYQFLYWTILTMLGNEMSILVMLRMLPLYIIYNVVICTICFLLMRRRAQEHMNDRYYV